MGDERGDCLGSVPASSRDVDGHDTTLARADLDRLINGTHAALQESVLRRIQGLPGWIGVPEVSFSIYGERGAIDILAWHQATRTLLILELKTLLLDPAELVRTMDKRVRLGKRIARDRDGRPRASVPGSSSPTRARTAGMWRSTGRSWRRSHDGRPSDAVVAEGAGRSGGRALVLARAGRDGRSRRVLSRRPVGLAGRPRSMPRGESANGADRAARWPNPDGWGRRSCQPPMRGSLAGSPLGPGDPVVLTRSDSEGEPGDGIRDRRPAARTSVEWHPATAPRVMACQAKRGAEPGRLPPDAQPR